MDFLQIMRECGYTGAFPGDTHIYATDAEFRAAERLAGVKASNANVVLALNALECHVAHNFTDYSHAAAATDRTRIAARENTKDRLQPAYDKAIKRAETKELEALETMLAPNPAHELLRRLRALAKERGLIGEPCGLYSVRTLADQIRAARHMRSVMDRHKIGRSGMAAGVPAHYEQLKAVLAEKHITV